MDGLEHRQYHTEFSDCIDCIRSSGFFFLYHFQTLHPAIAWLFALFEPAQRSALLLTASLSLSVRLFLLSLNVPMPNYTRTNKCNLKMYALLLRRFTQFVLLLLFFIFYFVSILFGCTATH